MKRAKNRVCFAHRDFDKFSNINVHEQKLSEFNYEYYFSAPQTLEKVKGI